MRRGGQDRRKGVLVRPPEGQSEFDSELQLLRAENAALKMEVDHLRRRDDHVNRAMAEIDEELRLAARLQRDFLPRSFPTIGSARFSTLFRPAGYVSGDLYDVQQLDEEHIGFYVGDAVGHGMPAALLTMFMRHSLKLKEVGRTSYRILNPSETLDRLNSAMLDQDLGSSTFATAVCGVVNAFTGKYVIASAGHPAPMVVPGRPDEDVRFIPAEGTLLGIAADPGFVDQAGTLLPGERLVLYTDGVEVVFPTAIRSAGQREFDDTRWRAELLSAREGHAQDMIDALANAMDGQPGSLSPGDDLTVMVLEMD